MSVRSFGGRLNVTYRCLGCGNEFHPYSGTDRLFCSVRCRSDVVSARKRVYRRVEDAAKDESMTPGEIVATLRAIRREPILIESDEEGEDG